VQPSLVLTHSLEDYMEDHTNTARLAVTAAFVRGMPNFPTRPLRRPYEGDTLVYHALPHGLRDAVGRRLAAETFVDVTDVQATRLAALAEHRSQQSWLDATQGMSSYLKTLEELSAAVGTMSKVFRLAEGWRRHNPLGFGAGDADPLRSALGRHAKANPRYARWLETSRL
jgi:LmbE family N-acetylglucosaminyl deacetylase